MKKSIIYYFAFLILLFPDPASGQVIKARSEKLSFDIKPKEVKKEIVEPPKQEYPDIIFRTNPSSAAFDGVATEEQFGKYYALIMGVNEYLDPEFLDLDQPISDANTLYEILTETYTFEKQNVIKIEDPTREDILSALDKISHLITDKDNLLIFYAGHGTWNERMNTGFWIPSDATFESSINWFRNSTLRDYIAGIDTRHTLVIADACFSGGIFKSREIRDASYGAQKLYERPSRKAMTSGTLETVPDQSVFLHYLSKRLLENESKFISSEEVFSSLRSAVIHNSPNIPQYGTIQDAGDEGGDFIFIRRK